ncbi:MAG: FtsX-like permease family protein [Paludibacter sp.]|nr:FtsX-like permease family protein [Paludibacter sp.]
MFSINTIQEIIASLSHNKLRTVLTGLSVSWGIFILIVLLGAGNGLKNGVSSNFNQRATNTVQMWSGTSSLPYQGLKSGRSLNFSEKQVVAVDEDLVQSDNQTGIIEKQSTITYNNEFGSYSVKGVNPNYINIFKLEFLSNGGRFINELDLKSNNKVIVIDKKIEDVLFKDVSPIGKNVKVGEVMFKVVGVNSKKERWGDGSAYIPFTTAQLIYNPDRKFHAIAMTVNNLETKEQNDEFNDKLKQTMSKSLRFDPKDTQALWLRNSQRNYIETMKIFAGITLFVSIIGIFTLIAGIVGVSNIMLVSVKERTREIGIRKAIGAPPAAILRSIIIEAILITTIFGYIGMVMGIGLTEIINFIMVQSAAQNPSDTGMSVFKDPTVQLSYVFISTAILIISGVIAGYMPARRAVRIKPIEAMREE